MDQALAEQIQWMEYSIKKLELQRENIARLRLHALQQAKEGPGEKNQT
jgi:hypothetical protein